LDSSGSESLMMLSAHATVDTTHVKYIWLQGTIQWKQVLILVDSGQYREFHQQICSWSTSFARDSGLKSNSDSSRWRQNCRWHCHSSC
jgi:hypothetical protein